MPVGLLLAGAISAEIAATIALRASDGFTRLWPSLVVVAGYPVSFYLLSLVLKGMSIGAAYAIWSAVGTAVVATIGFVAFGEPVNALKIMSLVLIVAGVVGLQLAGAER